MTVPSIDFSGLTLVQGIVLLLAIAAADFIVAVVTAAANRTLTLDLLDQWVVTHIALRVFPLFVLAVLGHGIAAIDLPAIGWVNLAFVAAAGTYALTTLGSIIASIQTASPPAPVVAHANPNPTNPTPGT